MKSREHHPTNIDVNGWPHILTSSSFGHNSWDLCSAIAFMAKNLCLKRYCRIDGSLEPFSACRFIFLDKSRGVRNIGIKENMILDKKRGFLLKIYSVNVIKSAVSCRFGHIYWRNP